MVAGGSDGRAEALRIRDGVVELVQRLLANDLRDLDDRMLRHAIELGLAGDRPVRLVAAITSPSSPGSRPGAV